MLTNRLIRITNRLTWVVFMLAAGSVSLAQHGGKAEPGRVEFKRGTTSATVTGKVRGDEQAEYVLAARKGQKLTIRLTSVPSRSTVFQLLGPGNDTLGLEHDANYGYSGKLPSDGDYFITVSRPTESRGTSSYKLIVTVR